MPGRSGQGAGGRAALLALAAAAALFLVALVAGLSAATAGLAGAAAPGASPSPPPPTSPAPSSSPAPSPSGSPAAPVVTCGLVRRAVLYGDTVAVSGAVAPAVPGATVEVLLDGAVAATAAVGGDGGWSAAFVARRGGCLSARLAPDGPASPAVALLVRPRLTLARSRPVPFLPVRYALRVAPADYGGPVAVRLLHHRRLVATARVALREGRGSVRLPLRGVGVFGLSFALPAADGLAARTVERRLDTGWRRLAVGSRGPWVRGLLARLRELRVLVPSCGDCFTRQTADAVMAFQKAWRLPRTYVVDGDDWRRLDTARVPRPRYREPRLHLEVDKTRQVLLVVREGRVRGLLAVSTGATGNTPEGAFRILTKYPATTSPYGGILYRTMGFCGDFAIHGYDPVPPYPASHGCVREPLWLADWVYDRSFIGERVYVYR